ncbi:hypothetical protein ASF20_09850 [Methylobacterium sp. Leaf88]|nr:hypothetical protein ASF20_09850 [Methylobacterium sp. Leaf88]
MENEAANSGWLPAESTVPAGSSKVDPWVSVREWRSRYRHAEALARMARASFAASRRASHAMRAMAASRTMANVDMIRSP